ncbi:carboxypeptidase regulatory-like domain-containing protein [Chitinophagaceae bacterium LWZ2-11]
MFIKKILPLLLVVLLPAALIAQVTTGTITGVVKNWNGQFLEGASVKVVHEPTGTVYSSASRANGQFILPNLRVGGPYTLTIQYVGLATKKFEDITVTLGSPVNVNVSLESATNLNEVTVKTTNKGSIISSQRTGTSTYISQRQIQSMPTINRSIQDFARLTPQASTMNDGGDGTSRGMSIGGQNNRYNSFSIDGANATDAFGLTSNGTNGGQANINPISVEAIQEVQIVLSPYDITQGGFTGGGINAITKSGSNKLHGAVYGVYQSQNFIGKNAPFNKTINTSQYANFENKTFGGALGGAIVKNKLFFYINAERYDKSTPLAFDPTISGSGSNFDPNTLADLRQYLITTYKYDPGTYGAINKKNSSTSVFGRIDWNINDKNKLTIRHSYVHGSNDLISRSASSITFSNGGYSFVNTTNSTVLELNSSFSSNSSNVLRVVYNNIRDFRSTPFFPSLTIQNASLTYNLGSDNSSQVNSLNQDNFTLTDNFTMYKGKHVITIGTNNEFYNTKNLFLQNYYGTYNFGGGNSSAVTNISDFKNNVTPYTYNVGYSTSSDPADKAAAIMHAAQLSVYGGDIWSLTDRFKLTYGLRVDMPVYFNKPPSNTAFDNDPTFAVFNVKTAQMPKITPLYSPRIGFNWDINGNATTQLRGGAGLFTGRIPFVWVSNQFSNTGVTNIAYTANAAAAAAANIHFNYNPNDVHAGAYIPSSTTPTATTINVIDKNFKFPQVFRANLAVEQRLPLWGLIGSLEAVYTKTLNNAAYQNLNLTQFPDSTVKLGANAIRPYWTKRLTNAYNDVIELQNTSKGYAYNFTAQLQKPFSKGWSGMVAYTYSHATSLTDLTSSVAYSNWRFAYAGAGGLNNLGVTNSNFDVGSRIIGIVSKEFRYGHGRFATTISLIYNGQSGQRISYLYSKTITGDDLSGAASNTTVYIPQNAAEANFVSFTRTVNGVSSTVSAAQQWADFQTFTLSNKYIKDHIGQNTDRNGDRLPFENHFDLRLAQDLSFIKGHKLQITFDVLNVGNLLNKDWGWSYNYGFNNYSGNLFTVVTNNSNKPTFNFDITRMNLIKGTYRAYSVSDFTSRWNSQIGLRYSF